MHHELVVLMPSASQTIAHTNHTTNQFSLSKSKHHKPILHIKNTTNPFAHQIHHKPIHTSKHKKHSCRKQTNSHIKTSETNSHMKNHHKSVHTQKPPQIRSHAKNTTKWIHASTTSMNNFHIKTSQINFSHQKPSPTN